MKIVSHLSGTLRTLYNTRVYSQQTGFVIRRKYTLQPRYYAATLWGYKWVKKLEDATVFRDRRFIRAELLATDMTIYCEYEIIEV